MSRDRRRPHSVRRGRDALLGVLLALAALPAVVQAADSLPGWTDGASKARIVGFVEAAQTAPCGAVARNGAGRLGAQ